MRQLHPASASQNELRPDAVGESQVSNAGRQSSPATPVPPVRTVAAARPQQPAVEPLAPARFKVQFTAGAALRDKLERLAALMPGTDLASMLDAAVTEKLERLESKRFGKTKRPRKTLEDADTGPGVRGIAAPVKRVVWERDGGRCTFVTRDGRRCPERHRLEFHHDEPYGFGGDRSADNVRLLCPAHNRYMAELDYGKDTMDRYRGLRDRVGEPAPSFQLRSELTVRGSSLRLRQAARLSRGREIGSRNRSFPLGSLVRG